METRRQRGVPVHGHPSFLDSPSLLRYPEKLGFVQRWGTETQRRTLTEVWVEGIEIPTTTFGQTRENPNPNGVGRVSRGPSETSHCISEKDSVQKKGLLLTLVFVFDTPVNSPAPQRPTPTPPTPLTLPKK